MAALERTVWASAIPRLVTVVALGAAILVVHWVALFLWASVGFLRRRCGDSRQQ